MLRFYLYLQKNIQRTENKLANRIMERQARPHTRYFFYFKFTLLNLRLFLWGLLSDVVKFIIILYKDPSESFNLFFRRKENLSYPYSYAHYKKIREKVRLFSFTGASTIIVVTVITTLILNLVIGPSLPIWAATYTFTQTDWNTLSANSAAHPDYLASWTEYSASSTSMSAGAVLSITSAASSTSQTIDADFNTGSTSQTTVGGDSVKLSPLPGGFGSGADGAITISTTTNINTAAIAGGRTCADGISYNVTALTANTATLSGTPPAGCYAAGDQVMLLNIQGSGDKYGNTGNYEILDVQSVFNNTIYFTSSKTKYYGSGASNDNDIGGVAEDAWETKATALNTVGTGGSLVYPGSGDFMYALRGNSTSDFWRYSISGNSWTAMAPTLDTVAEGSLVSTFGDFIYAFRGNATADFWRYSISGNSWTAMTSALDTVSYIGSHLVYPGSGDYIYASRGANTPTFWRYSISGNSWEGRANQLVSIKGVSMAYPGSGDFIYSWKSGSTSGGTGFYRYSMSGNSWTTMTSMPAISYDTSLVSQGGDYMYAFRGNGTSAYYRYSISGNNWTTMTNTPSPVGNGAAMAYISQGGYIYGLGGNNGTNFWRYAFDSQKVILQRVPQYTNVTIQSGGLLTANAWDGTKGGVLAFLANGTVDVQSGGSITMGDKGYRGGGSTGSQGESYNKVGVVSGGANLGGGGGSYFFDGNCVTTDDGAGGGYGTPGASNYGTGGGIYGDINLSRLFLGSAGGRGSPGAGRGGGINYIEANSINVDGNIVNNGGDGAVFGGGGAGSGGSTYLTSNSLALGTNLVNAQGGSGANYFEPDCGTGYDSGAGGAGRIHLKANSISGTTNPTAATSSLTTTYYASGTYTSGAIDTGQNVASWGNISWTHSGGQTITMKARTDADGNFSDATAWASCSNISSGNALATGGCATAGHRYVQYQASLSTADTAVTPSLDDVTVGYNFYPTDQFLISSAYDSAADTNIMGSISWDEDSTLPAGTNVVLSMRTASSSSDLVNATWSQFSATTTNCTKNGIAVTCPSAALPAAFKTDNDDRWFQYKVTLVSNGENTPTVSEVRVQYVINAPPEVQSVTASQGLDGLITINYETRDLDTTTGSPANQGLVTPSFYYSTNGGGNWSSITAGLTAGATDPKTVAEVDWNPYNLIWDPRVMNINSFSTSTQIRVVVNDLEGANNLGFSSSANFRMDAKKPALGSPTMVIQATGSPAAITIAATDDSTFCMKVSLNQADLSDLSNCVPYANTATISLVTDPDTVYIRFKDEYQNLSDIASAITPETPANMIIRDVSNVNIGIFQLFIAWKAVATPVDEFARYVIYRSTDNQNFSLLTEQTNKALNYYLDQDLTGTPTYYYRVATEDTAGNLSFFSGTVYELADGQGGTDTTPPTISNVSVTATTTQSATIVWDTNELADSTIGYSTTPGNFITEVGLATMLDNAAGIGRHELTLTGLAPNTAYYFQVKSTDPTSNPATDNFGGDGYTFSTKPGAVITAVTANHIDNFGAEISWTTDILSDSVVIYSQNSDLSQPNEIHGSYDLVTAHTVELSNLTQATRYYYLVKSTDVENNQATDDNAGSYFTFVTTNDTVPPAISGIATSSVADTFAQIVWQTDEPASTFLQYGAASGNYATQTPQNVNMNRDHSLTLSNLVALTTYYFRVICADANNNTATSSEFSFTTSDVLLTETQAKVREEVAKETGKQEQVAATPPLAGGGVVVIDKTDSQAPALSNIQATDLKSDSATVSWITSEIADSLLEYGTSIAYGDGKGRRDKTASHSFPLANLLPEMVYHYRVSSADASGNLAASQDLIFTTPSLLDELKKDEAAVAEVEALAKSEKESMLVDAAQKAMEIVSRVAGEVSLNVLENTLNNQYDSLAKLANAIPAPIFGGEPSVITTANTATVTWRTDKDASSLVAYAPAAVYEINQGQADPYLQTVGNPEAKTRAHLVSINELTPETTYHYQLRSKAVIGPQAKSRDFTFKTKSETLEITNYAVQDITAQKAVFKWLTNLETDSQAKYIPYRGNALAIDEFKIKAEKAFTTLHEITIDDFEGGVVYEIELSGKDQKGNMVTKTLPTFSTSLDDLPPEISSVQTDSAINPGKEVKIQTIITWQTNEPAIGRVMFEKGISTNGLLSESTALESNYIKKHVAVITKFDPGAVYTFKIEVKDSAGNTSLSKTFTILTPRQKETVFQLILKNFESTFGWVNKLGK